MYKQINSQLMEEAVDEVYDAAEEIVSQIKADQAPVDTRWLDTLIRSAGKIDQYKGVEKIRSGSTLTEYGVKKLDSMGLDSGNSIYGKKPDSQRI